MRFVTSIVASALIVTLALFAQNPGPNKADQAAIVRAAQDAAFRALNFHQGDVASLMRARADFTPDGWKDFMKHMEGFIDQKGAPTFTSHFTPSRSATVLDDKDGVVRFRVPGTLTQSNNLGRTTYRAAIEVYATRDRLIHGGKAIKIQRLEQITCVGHRTSCE